MQVHQINEWIANLDSLEKDTLLFSYIVATLNEDAISLSKLKEQIQQMLIDDASDNVIRIY